MGRAKSGTAALEFALVAPALLAMFLAMMCFGLYFIYVHELQELASAATRASVAGLTAAERDSLARQFVASSLSNFGVLVASDVTVTTAASGTPAIYYAVTVGYSLKDTPVPMLSKLLSVPVSDIQRSSTIVFGGY